ncbi:MAG: ATP-binding protein [Minicystis sp.]
MGDGSAFDDGIYVLLKEVMDNSIDEFMMGEGNKIDVNVKDGVVSIRDYGRGIPLGKVVEVVSKMNTGGKYDSEAFKKSIGLNGVGTKAVNALSNHFEVTAYRDGQAKTAEFSEKRTGERTSPGGRAKLKKTELMWSFVRMTAFSKNIILCMSTWTP